VVTKGVAVVVGALDDALADDPPSDEALALDAAVPALAATDDDAAVVAGDVDGVVVAGVPPHAPTTMAVVTRSAAVRRVRIRAGSNTSAFPALLPFRFCLPIYLTGSGE
jgi:hypothetical protein